MAESLANLNTNNEEVYSTDETLIGIYCGHRLYRKVITGITIPSTATAGTGASSHVPVGASFTKAIRVSGIVTTAQGHDIIAPFVYPTGGGGLNYIISFRAINNTNPTNPNTIEVWNSATSWNGLPAEVTIDYIKD